MGSDEGLLLGSRAVEQEGRRSGQREKVVSKGGPLYSFIVQSLNVDCPGMGIRLWVR